MIESLFSHRELIDITPKVSSSLAVFPGDLPFSRNVSMSFLEGDNITLSSINSTVHLGAHTDAPNHYSKGVGIDQVDLSVYLGLCQVISVKLGEKERIRKADIEGIPITASRVLFKTSSFPDPQQWTNQFNALSRELIDKLVSLGVKLVGIDTPSVDLADDKELEAHSAIAKHGLAILEGIVLNDVKDGLYELIALPLPIKDADASPVRAILIPRKLK